MNVSWLLALPLLASNTPHAGSTPAPATPPRDVIASTHANELRAHGVAELPRRTLPTPDQLRAGREKKVSKIVYGYYPHWAHDLGNLRWEDLTHLAWFSIEMNEAGNVNATHGWPDTETVEAAHAADVRVDLAFTLFSGTGIRTLVNDPARRANAAKTMVDLLEEGNADGISVDFEGFVDGTRAGFVTFIQELRAELDGRGHPDAEISLAGPAVDWGSEWDLEALLDTADYFFIMGYDLFWGGSTNAGPPGLLRITPAWTGAASWSMLRSITTYTSLVSAEKRQKIIYGVPYYGREYITTSGNMAASATSSPGAVIFYDSMDDLAAGRERLWDEGTRNPWYKWQAGGTWHQVYYDDGESLAHKYQLALDQDLGGVGMWALNYDVGHPELWDALETKLAPTMERPVGHRENPIAIDAFPYHDERDTKDGGSQYFNYYSCDPGLNESGREVVYQIDVCQPGTITATVPESADVDPDVHLLGDIVESACIARGHTDLSAEVMPGRYFVTVDTFVGGNQVEMEGPYTLDVDFIAAPGSEPCAAHLSCQAGTCACPGAAETECGGACVDTTTDNANCGACGNDCGASAHCEAGACVGGPTSSTSTGGDDGTGAGPGAEDDGACPPGSTCVEGEAGCSCRTGASDPDHAPLALAAILAAAAVTRRRRSR